MTDWTQPDKKTTEFFKALESWADARELLRSCRLGSGDGAARKERYAKASQALQLAFEVAVLELTEEPNDD